jgi:DNA polymerase-1
MMKKVFIIDFMNLAFRNFHAFEKMNLTTSSGIPTGTLFGMASFMVNLIKNENPDYIAVAMESDESFRKDMFPSYKENRSGKPSEFEEYLPHVIQMFHTLGIPLFKFRGMEADDVIGILTKKFKDEADIFIVSGDKDFMQLVDDNVKLYMPKSKGLYSIAGKNEVFEKFGCRPDQVVDVLALMGDKVDCIPGVQGIGPKGASKLISQFGSLENMYADSEALRKSVSTKQYEKLSNGMDDAFMSYKLATIVQDVDIKLGLNDISFSAENLKSQQFLDFCDTYELTSIKNKIFVDLNGID